MDKDGQMERYCPVCKQDTDQQFTLVDEDENCLTLFVNCLVCYEYEDLIDKRKIIN